MAKFENLREAMLHLKTTTAKEAAAKRKERFNETLGGRFDEVPSGNFKSALPDFSSVSVIKAPADKETGKVSKIFVIPYIKQGKGEKHETLILSDDGVLSGKIPPAWKIKTTKEQLYDEVLNIMERIHLDFFESVSDEILPPDKREKGEGGEGGGKEAERERLTDPRRIEFMRNQKEVLFGINGINTGFRGYYGFVFPKFMVLENDSVGNAAYFFEFDNPVEVEPGIFNLPPSQRIKKEERKKILEEKWTPIANLTKRQSLEMGAHRVIHPQTTDEKWEEKMLEEINKRT